STRPSEGTSTRTKQCSRTVTRQMPADYGVVRDRLGQHDRVVVDHLTHTGDQILRCDDFSFGHLTSKSLVVYTLVLDNHAVMTVLHLFGINQLSSSGSQLLEGRTRIRTGETFGGDMPQRHLILDRIDIHDKDPCL